MPYYFTPILQEEKNVDVAKIEGGVTVSAMTDLVGGIRTLTLDREAGRYVLNCPEAQPAQEGWEEKTAEEVNADYPGLIGG
tara:strand:- start:61 stop:303 length:243 start_codon:yes stop_codon:yes gene_type:complete